MEETMSSSCIEEVSVPDDSWYRIANGIVKVAPDITVWGFTPRPDIRVKNRFLNARVLQEGSLGLSELHGWLVGMRGVWIFSSKAKSYVPVLKIQLPTMLGMRSVSSARV